MTAATGPVLAAAWAGVIIWWAWSTRPLSRHVIETSAEWTRPDSGTGAIRELLAVLGRSLRRTVRRPPNPATDVRVGAAAVAAVTALIVDVKLVPIAVAVAAGLPPFLDRSAARRRLARLAIDTPDVIDLLVLTAGSGLNLRLALSAVANRSPPSWRPALQAADDRIGLGQPLAASLDDASHELGEGAGPLLRALAAAERDGSPLLPTLRRLANDARLDRRRAGEEAARRLPVKLLFPLVLCVLPAFAVLTIAPLLASAFGSLRL